MTDTVVSRHRASTQRTAITAGERRHKKIPVIVPVSEAVLDWLVSKKYLAAKERENDAAIKHAIESFLSTSTKSGARNHGHPSGRLTFVDATNEAPPAEATPRDALHHTGGNESEIAALVGRGYLPQGDRNDPVAIKAAVESVIGHRFRGIRSRQCFAGAHNPVLETQTLGNGRRQAARFEAREGCPGAQDRGDPASNVG
jgi:hypothetical protein